MTIILCVTDQVMEACCHQGQNCCLHQCHPVPHPPLPSHRPGFELWHHQGDLPIGQPGQLQVLVYTPGQVSQQQQQIMM